MENIRPKISVITICYNLEKTVKSVISQSYDNLEYVIVDGGSTDETLSKLQQYKDKINVLISEPDNGIYDALNKGIKSSRGEWIVCMNAGDTFVSPTTLEIAFKHRIPSGKTVLYSDFNLCFPDGRILIRKTDRATGEIHHQNVIYRRALHEHYGYYIVTHPYIISDLLFFLAIPEEQYLKIDNPIANVKSGGISDHQWCTEQAWAAKMIYGMDSIPGIYYKYLRARIYLILKGIKSKICR